MIGESGDNDTGMDTDLKGQGTTRPAPGYAPASIHTVSAPIILVANFGGIYSIQGAIIICLTFA